MKKSVIIWAIILIGILILIAVAGFFIFFNKGMSSKEILENPKKAMDFCKNSPTDKQNDCYFYISENLKNNSYIALDSCLAISDDGTKKNCVDMLISFETNQTRAVEICNYFAEDKNFREHCYNSIHNFADIDKDTELLMCEKKSGTDQANCYSGIAESYWQTNAPKAAIICNKITDETIKERCINSFSSSFEIVRANPDLAITICDSLNIKSRCYQNVANALSSSNPKLAVEICKKINDDMSISGCYDSVWFYSDNLTISEYEFSLSMCGYLTTKKDDCLRKIEAIFIDTNVTRAKEACKFMSQTNSERCLAEVNR